jgi:hypothetical protein
MVLGEKIFASFGYFISEVEEEGADFLKGPNEEAVFTEQKAGDGIKSLLGTWAAALRGW